MLQRLAQKSITKQALYKALSDNFELLPEVLIGVSSSKASVRYGCAGVLVELSSRYPEKMYPYMDKFVALLDSKYRILLWNALAIIANLCKVDVDKKFDAILDKYYAFLQNEYLVTVVNVVGNSGKIALAKPYIIPKMTVALLNVEEISVTNHLTEECKRVVAEKAVESFNQFYDEMNAEEKTKVLSFVKRQVCSSRKSLKEKAELFLKHRSSQV